VSLWPVFLLFALQSFCPSLSLYRVFQKELYNFKRLYEYKFIQRHVQRFNCHNVAKDTEFWDSYEPM
jgi:hypothetical protein